MRKAVLGDILHLGNPHSFWNTWTGPDNCYAWELIHDSQSWPFYLEWLCREFGVGLTRSDTRG